MKISIDAAEAFQGLLKQEDFFYYFFFLMYSLAFNSDIMCGKTSIQLRAILSYRHGFNGFILHLVLPSFVLHGNMFNLPFEFHSMFN